MKTVVQGPPGSGKTTDPENISILKILKDNGFGYSSMDNYVVNTYRKPLALKTVGKITYEFNMDFEKVMKKGLLGTTHSVCSKLLFREETGPYHYSDYGFVKEHHKKKFCEEENLEYVEEKENPDQGMLPDALGNLLFSIKSYMVHTDEPWYEAPIPEKLKKDLDRSTVKNFINNWEDFKRNHSDKKSLLDYDDVLERVYEDKIVPPVDYLIEDEFHDKSPLQYKIYKMWAKEIPKVYVFGDPLQAIYGFMGSSPEFFENEKDEARKEDNFYLKDRSWRFGSDIWDYARAVGTRKGLKVPEIEPQREGTTVRYLNMSGFKRTVKKIDKHQKGASVFYLVRSNHMIRPVAGILGELGLFYEVGHPTEEDRLIKDFYNEVARLSEEASKMSSWNPLQIKVPDNLIDNLIKSFGRGRIVKSSEMDRTILVDPQFVKKLAKANPFHYLSSNTPKKISKHKKKLENWWDNFNGEPLGATTHQINTIHGAKGKDAWHVFLFDSKTKKIQQQQRETPNNEARILYTGLTRAKKHLWIVKGPFKKYSYDLPYPNSIRGGGEGG